MIVRWKDAAKLFGITVMSFCAVFVCTLFLNYQLDLLGIAGLIEPGQMQAVYDAQIMNGKVTAAVSGGCLCATSVVMLLFYVKHYVDAHRENLGVLKALGYSNGRIAKSFSAFGLSVLIGTALGYGVCYAMLPFFYGQLTYGSLPEFAVRSIGRSRRFSLRFRPRSSR